MARANAQALKDHWAKEIAEVRGLLSMTQREFANEVGVSPRTVSRWETGETKPRGRDKAKLAAIATAAGGVGLSSALGGSIPLLGGALEKRVSMLEAQVRLLTLASAKEAA